ncbi:methyltransferase-like protein 4 isoform X2 [Cyanistes caeruleus]|uniref:methyltransferase-like protein 4 isoform X2 n=1 Tax=Cyanistes caeruleus TaxID=156563 RepID=UPI000CDB55F2|nr:methyltransferase-like protein 4 isoform X2 [Cyanistes caeruleus]
MAAQRHGGARGGGCSRKCRWLVKAVVSGSSSFVLKRGLRMSVVHGLTVGWLVDHLSFINQCGYEICDSFAHPGGVIHSTSVTSTEDCYRFSTFAAMPSSSDGPPFDPGDAVEAESKRAKMRYVFWEEFLDIPKPYIAAACEEQLCPALR